MAKNKDKLNYLLLLIFGLIGCVIIIGIFAIINCGISKCQSTMWLDGSAWIGLVVGTFGTVSTFILGYVAVWQNIKQREDNIDIQNRLIQPFISKEIVLCDKNDLKEGMEHTVVKISNTGVINTENDNLQTRTSLSLEYGKLNILNKECADLCKDGKIDLYLEKIKEYKIELGLHHLKFSPNQFLLKNCGTGNAMNFNVLINSVPVCINKSLVSTDELKVNILFDFYENTTTNKFSTMKLDFEILYSNAIGQFYAQKFYIKFKANKEGTPTLEDDCNTITVPQRTDKNLKEILGIL